MCWLCWGLEFFFAVVDDAGATEVLWNSQVLLGVCSDVFAKCVFLLRGVGLLIWGARGEEDY